MYKVDGFLDFPLRRGRHKLDLRVPEERLIADAGTDAIRRSPAVGAWIAEYRAADDDDDQDGRMIALKGVIDANRADHAAAGVPVYAHAALPDDFAAEFARRHTGSLEELLAKFEPRAYSVQVAP